MITPTFKLERQLWRQGYRNIVGLDEVGRGALAGPVVAGAVIFPGEGVSLLRKIRKETPFQIRDSKLLSPAQREGLAPLIKTAAVAWAVGWSSEKFIDQHGIAAATERAMLKALNNLSIEPDFYLIDYFQLKGLSPEKQSGVADGDTLVATIAAASVIAKVYRDEIMITQHEKYPHYGFDRHKGYGTKFHREALRRFGPCPLHRLNFIPNDLLNLTLDTDQKEPII